MSHTIKIEELQRGENIPYDLLISADPSKMNIDKYIFDSSIYAAFIEEQVIGCYVLYPVDKDTVEIKNIVVDENHQGKGIGTILLNDAIEKSKSMKFKTLVIGTGNSSVGQLYLYQKAGFRITNIKSDFFTENYDQPIIENGIECRDMIVLTKQL